MLATSTSICAKVRLVWVWRQSHILYHILNIAQFDTCQYIHSDGRLLLSYSYRISSLLIHVVYLQDDFPLHFISGFSQPLNHYHPLSRWFHDECETNQQSIKFNFNVEFCWSVLSHSHEILLLHHFNLRSLYFQSLQSLPNWIQLPTLETSPMCTSFQRTNKTNVIWDKIIVLCDLNCVFHFRKGIAGKFHSYFMSPGS